MTRVHCYSVFAYHKNDDGSDLRRYHIPEWNLAKAVRWALERGSDTVLIEATGVENRTDTVHHVCADSRCPGGC